MADTPAARLAAEGLTIPAPASALGAYVPAVRTGRLVLTSGQLPFVAGELLATGAVGAGTDVETAVRCAEQAALNALAAASAVCDLDTVTRVVKLVGYVSSAPGFGAQPSVVDGASRVLAIAFGERGRHAREAVGVAALPMDATVEISLILEVE